MTLRKNGINTFVRSTINALPTPPPSMSKLSLTLTMNTKRISLIRSSNLRPARDLGGKRVRNILGKKQFNIEGFNITFVITLLTILGRLTRPNRKLKSSITSRIVTTRTSNTSKGRRKPLAINR